jgi:hypothetical protein
MRRISMAAILKERTRRRRKNDVSGLSTPITLGSSEGEREWQDHSRRRPRILSLLSHDVAPDVMSMRRTRKFRVNRTYRQLAVRETHVIVTVALLPCSLRDSERSRIQCHVDLIAPYSAWRSDPRYSSASQECTYDEDDRPSPASIGEPNALGVDALSATHEICDHELARETRRYFLAHFKPCIEQFHVDAIWRWTGIIAGDHSEVIPLRARRGRLPSCLRWTLSETETGATKRVS